MSHRRGLPPRWLRAIALAGVIALAAAPAWAADETYPGDVGQAIAAILVFLVLLAILGKWAWGPMVQQLRRREEGIDNAVQQADKREKEANQLLQAYRDRLASVETEVKQMQAKSREKAEAERDEILEATRQEARKALEDASHDIERAKKRALGELQDTTVLLATEIAGRVIQQKLTAKQHQRMMDESLKQIRKRAGKET